MYSSETQSKLSTYRQLAREGTATPEQLREAIRLLRGDRVAAQATSGKAKTAKAAKAKDKDIDSDDLLSELDGL